jgi:hypothetical protein
LRQLRQWSIRWPPWCCGFVVLKVAALVLTLGAAVEIIRKKFGW